MAAKYDFRPTIAALLPALTTDRDARIETHNNVNIVVMDDDGYGEFGRAVSSDEAAALIAEGFCRDAR